MTPNFDEELRSELIAMLEELRLAACGQTCIYDVCSRIMRIVVGARGDDRYSLVREVLAFNEGRRFSE